MNALVQFAAVLLVATVGLSGCAVARGSHLVTGSTWTPTNPADVRIYRQLPAEYEKIAVVSVDSKNDFASQQHLGDNAIARLKVKACKVGGQRHPA